MNYTDYPITSTPTDPTKFYGQLLYRDWFFGPFDTLEQVRELVRDLDAHDPFWSYDGFGVMRGRADWAEFRWDDFLPREAWKA
jgi:hypothetical protein